MALIQETILQKACMKQDIFALTKDVFKELTEVLDELKTELHTFIKDKDGRVEIDLKTPSPFGSELLFGSDMLVYSMHTNVFTFPENHIIQKNPYVKEDGKNSYVGVIHVYNFLADSYRYHRMNDSGYLVARIFVNRERHFFVEGRGQLGFMYNDFANALLDKKNLRAIAETTLQHALEFDLYSQPYDNVKEVTVADLAKLSQNQQLKTGKRLGFQFQSEIEEVKF